MNRAVFVLPAALAAALAVHGAEPGARDGAEALFRRRCSTCHAPDRVAHRVAGRDEWREIVERMRRMPQSGITRADAAVILDYLAARGAAPEADGGREAYGEEWIAVLETAVVKDGRVRIGGVEYEAQRDGRSVTLRRGADSFVLALPEWDGVPVTARLRRWSAGGAVFEVHLLLYRIRGDTVRIARALRREG